MKSESSEHTCGFNSLAIASHCTANTIAVTANTNIAVFIVDQDGRLNCSTVEIFFFVEALDITAIY